MLKGGLRLDIYRKKQFLRTYKLTLDQLARGILVGRAPGSDLRLEDAEGIAERQSLFLARTDGFRIRELSAGEGSRPTVFAPYENGGYTRKVTLKRGEELLLTPRAALRWGEYIAICNPLGSETSEEEIPTASLAAGGLPLSPSDRTETHDGKTFRFSVENLPADAQPADTAPVPASASVPAADSENEPSDFEATLDVDASKLRKWKQSVEPKVRSMDDSGGTLALDEKNLESYRKAMGGEGAGADAMAGALALDPPTRGISRSTVNIGPDKLKAWREYTGLNAPSISTSAAQPTEEGPTLNISPENLHALSQEPITPGSQVEEAGPTVNIGPEALQAWSSGSGSQALPSVPPAAGLQEDSSGPTFDVGPEDLKAWQAQGAGKVEEAGPTVNIGPESLRALTAAPEVYGGSYTNFDDVSEAEDAGPTVNIGPERLRALTAMEPGATAFPGADPAPPPAQPSSLAAPPGQRGSGVQAGPMVQPGTGGHPIPGIAAGQPGTGRHPIPPPSGRQPEPPASGRQPLPPASGRQLPPPSASASERLARMAAPISGRNPLPVVAPPASGRQPPPAPKASSTPKAASGVVPKILIRREGVATRDEDACETVFFRGKTADAILGKDSASAASPAPPSSAPASGRGPVVPAPAPVVEHQSSGRVPPSAPETPHQRPSDRYGTGRATESTPGIELESRAQALSRARNLKQRSQRSPALSDPDFGEVPRVAPSAAEPGADSDVPDFSDGDAPKPHTRRLQAADRGDNLAAAIRTATRRNYTDDEPTIDEPIPAALLPDTLHSDAEADFDVEAVGVEDIAPPAPRTSTKRSKPPRMTQRSRPAADGRRYARAPRLFDGISQTIFPLTSPSCRIGRGDDMDLVVKDRSVSKHHATIHYQDGVVTVTDHESRNRTRIFNRLIDPLVPTTLKDGDLVFLGKAELVFLASGRPEVEGPHCDDKLAERLVRTETLAMTLLDGALITAGENKRRLLEQLLVDGALSPRQWGEFALTPKRGTSLLTLTAGVLVMLVLIGVLAILVFWK